MTKIAKHLFILSAILLVGGFIYVAFADVPISQKTISVNMSIQDHLQ